MQFFRLKLDVFVCIDIQWDFLWQVGISVSYHLNNIKQIYALVVWSWIIYTHEKYHVCCVYGRNGER